MDTGAMPEGFGYDIRGHNPIGDDRIRDWIDNHLAERADEKRPGFDGLSTCTRLSGGPGESLRAAAPIRPRQKPTDSDEITFDDCCRLILEQGLPPREPAVPGKPDYRGICSLCSTRSSALNGQRKCILKFMPCLGR